MRAVKKTKKNKKTSFHINYCTIFYKSESDVKGYFRRMKLAFLLLD